VAVTKKAIRRGKNKGVDMKAQVVAREATAGLDSVKRRQILDGARSVFLAKGFDAASMNDIAAAAGVSKGTLYVYFDNKEQLFEEIVQEECLVHAESVFNLDPADHNVADVLTRVGTSYVEFLCRKAATLRTVIAIADRMPDIGKSFYETGPVMGIARVADYVRAQTEAGVLAIEDFEVAAAQFLEACHAPLFKPVLFNFAPPPELSRIEHVVGIAVRTFMAAYVAQPGRVQ
jgi:AcrR family transcriptional regulator